MWYFNIWFFFLHFSWMCWFFSTFLECVGWDFVLTFLECVGWDLDVILYYYTIGKIFYIDQTTWSLPANIMGAYIHNIPYTIQLKSQKSSCELYCRGPPDIITFIDDLKPALKTVTVFIIVWQRNWPDVRFAYCLSVAVLSDISRSQY